MGLFMFISNLNVGVETYGGWFRFQTMGFIVRISDEVLFDISSRYRIFLYSLPPGEIPLSLIQRCLEDSDTQAAIKEAVEVRLRLT